MGKANVLAEGSRIGSYGLLFLTEQQGIVGLDEQ
jgi:hypothetical protein